MQIDKVPLPIDRLPQDAPDLLHITVIGESPIRSSGVIETPQRTTLDKPCSIPFDRDPRSEMDPLDLKGAFRGGSNRTPESRLSD